MISTERYMHVTFQGQTSINTSSTSYKKTRLLRTEKDTGILHFKDRGLGPKHHPHKVLVVDGSLASAVDFFDHFGNFQVGLRLTQFLHQVFYVHLVWNKNPGRWGTLVWPLQPPTSSISSPSFSSSLSSSSTSSPSPPRHLNQYLRNHL